MLKILFLLACIFSEAFAHEGKFHLFLKNFHGREVHVYLPPGYEKLTNLPVLFMNDGQNAFDPSRAYLGRTWRAEETLTELIERNLIRPIVVVAIDNLPSRIMDYTFDHDPSVGSGGGAHHYLDQLERELLPLVRRHVKITTKTEETGILGSSLGGLVSLYAGSRNLSPFGLVGAMSPSLWWNGKSMIKFLSTSRTLPGRLYLDSGTAGGEKPLDVLELEEKISTKFTPGSLKVFVKNGHDHSETSWADRLDEALLHLFPSHP